MQALRTLLPDLVKVVRDGALVLLPARAIVPGDVISLQEGNAIPADARVVEAHALRINNATVTGSIAGIQSRTTRTGHPSSTHS